MRSRVYHLIFLLLCMTIIPQALMANSGVAALNDLAMEGGGGVTLGLGGLISIISFLVSCMMFFGDEEFSIPYWIVGVCISYLFCAINWYKKGLPIIPEISSFFDIFMYFFAFGFMGFLLLGPIALLHLWLKFKLSK